MKSSKFLFVALFAMVGCRSTNEYGIYIPPRTESEIKAITATSKCGVIDEQVDAGVSWDKYKECIYINGADDEGIKHTKLMWDGAVYLRSHRVKNTCYKVFSSVKEGQDCVLSCRAEGNICLSNTEPATSERAACISLERDCENGCVAMARQGNRVEVPCE